MSATLVYRSSWSQVKPLVYTDDSCLDSVNKFVDSVFKKKMRTNRLVNDGQKMYYKPSEEYKQYVVRFRRTK